MTQILIPTNLIPTVKLLSWGALIVLTAYAGIGVVLFGLDARKLHQDLNELRIQKNDLVEGNTKAQQEQKETIWKAQTQLSESISSTQDAFRKTISDARQETQERVKELDNLISTTREQAEKRMSELSGFLKEASTQMGTLAQQYKTLKEQCEELGAIVQEMSEKTHAQPKPTSSADSNSKRSNIALIKEVIESSQYEWTTLDRVQHLTGLTEDTIMDEVRAAPDIRISRAKKTQKPIFKFKE